MGTFWENYVHCGKSLNLFRDAGLACYFSVFYIQMKMIKYNYTDFAIFGEAIRDAYRKKKTGLSGKNSQVGGPPQSLGTPM